MNNDDKCISIFYGCKNRFLLSLTQSNISAPLFPMRFDWNISTDFCCFRSTNLNFFQTGSFQSSAMFANVTYDLFQFQCCGNLIFNTNLFCKNSKASQKVTLLALVTYLGFLICNWNHDKLVLIPFLHIPFQTWSPL